MHGYENSRIPRLFELMAERRIKAKEIADATGTSTSSFTDWKSGKSVPSGDRLIALANFFDVSVEYLLGIDSAENAIDLKIQTEIKELSDEQKKDILKYVKFIKEY